MNGGGLLTFPLPIEFFCKYSFMEMVCQCITGYAPLLVGNAAKCESPLEQMKWCVAYQITQCHLAYEQGKPFNPKLGETFQAESNGFPFYAEQLCHHPPITAFLFYGPGFRIQGTDHSMTEIQLNMNSVKIGTKGRYSIKFHDLDNTIHMFYAPSVMDCIVLGSTRQYKIGCAYILNPKNLILT